VADIFAKLKKYSATLTIGVVFTIALLWFYVRAGDYFPSDPDGYRFYIQVWFSMITFSVTMALVMKDKYVGKLFGFSFFKEWWKFLLAAIVSGLAFFGLIWLVKSGVMPTSGLSFWVKVFYALFVAYPEEILFRGIIPNSLLSRKYKRWQVYMISAVLFALFHWTLGRSWTTLIIYIPLGYLWMWMRDKFSPVTNFANAGSHWIYDVLVLTYGTA